MTAATIDLLDDLHRAGVVLFVDGPGGLTFYATPGTMTPERLASLREHKPDLLVLLNVGGPDEIIFRFNERAGIAEYHGGLSRPDAERLACRELVQGGGR